MAARKSMTVELPDQAAARVLSNRRPVSSTNTGDFFDSSLGVGKADPVRLPSHVIRQC